ncbi:MAG: bifunctional diaminohydroxyphosphoribosylaminopyrimidine deaminase/5-amino-6-(5-phosphoribosylamino)uracil reductase RibD [Candidatus Coatesbacteria bacterium]
MAIAERFMLRALALAERGRGYTGTNPLVGAVVVHGSRVVGEGWHVRYGGPHAEAVALASAGDRARGATLYVTLEPCSRMGKMPPCTRMVIQSGIRRVVVALRDPLERGRGLAELRRHGIQAKAGVLERQARAQNHEWFVRLRTRRPYVILKLATTLDGRIADARRRSKWITSPAARNWTRQLRRRVDAVMVGAGTAIADDPRLTAPGRTDGPIRIVVDGRARLGLKARLLRGGNAIMVVSAKAPRARVGSLRAAGARIVTVAGRGARMPLRAVLKALYAEGVGSIVCEGGADLAGGLVAGRLVDRAVIVLAPRLLGGRGSLPSILGPDSPLARALSLGPVRVHRVGPDVIVDGDVPGRN